MTQEELTYSTIVELSRTNTVVAGRVCEFATKMSTVVTHPVRPGNCRCKWLRVARCADESAASGDLFAGCREAGVLHTVSEIRATYLIPLVDDEI